MMRFNVMDHTGHSTQDFTKDSAEVAAAMVKFAELTKPPSQGGKGYAAARRDAPGHLTHIRKFDPNATEIVFTPPLKGG